MKQFEGRIAAITGAGSGIGRALAHELTARGAVLEIADVDEAGLSETAERVTTRGATVTTAQVDVADRAQLEAWAADIGQRHGCVHLLINNAGVALAGTIEELTFEEFEWLLGINLFGTIWGTKLFLPLLRKAEEGHVVNVSSVFGLVGVPGQAAYNVSKFGVRGFTECLRTELELEGAPISCTCVHPGGIQTNIARNARLGAHRGAERPSHEELSEEFDRLARTTPEKAARKILRGVERNARRVLIGFDAFLIDRVQRLAPTGYQRAMVALARRRPAMI